MNTSMQNQLLRGGSSGSGSAEVLRAASATARQSLPALLGTDDTALHFKRMLSEYKQNEPTATPAPNATPLNSGSSSPSAASAREEPAAPSPLAKPEDKLPLDARPQTRRIQAKAHDQAQSAKTESGRPSAASPQSPTNAPSAIGSADEAQVFEEGHPVDPQAAGQLIATHGLFATDYLDIGSSHRDMCDDRMRDHTTDEPQTAALLGIGANGTATPACTARGHDHEGASRILAGSTTESSSRPQDATGAPVTMTAQQTGSVFRTEAAGGEAPAVEAEPSATPLEPLQLNRQLANALGNVNEQSGGAMPSSRASANAEPTSGPKAQRSPEVVRLDRNAGLERGRAEPSAAVAESTAFSTAAKGQLGGSSSEAANGFVQELRGALSASVPVGTASAADTSHALDRFEAASRSAGEPTPISMTQGLHEASFAPELGARLSVLAADGVQEAQLHLNPAELGPVAIQIVLEGQQAQISFHAEHAETRQVLEQGLPDLAAALRDAGLTLSGGGVFEQARDRSGQEQPSGKAEASRAKSARSISLDDASASLAGVATSARRSQGMLDLYA